MTQEILIVRKKGRGRDKKKRPMSENSLKNLKSVRTSEEGKALAKLSAEAGRERPYTDCYAVTGKSITPEFVRLSLNVRIRLQQGQMLAAAKREGFSKELVKAIEKEMKREAIPKGMTWAQANSIRMHMNAVLEGDVNAATEVRESVEGRSTQRIEFTNTNNKLQQLLEEFRHARQNRPPAPSPTGEPATPP